MIGLHGSFFGAGDGPVSVTTIDAFRNFGRNVAIKIDVEGGKIEVLRGACQTIRSAAACVVAIEAHPRWQAGGPRSSECLLFLERSARFQFSVLKPERISPRIGPF